MLSPLEAALCAAALAAGLTGAWSPCGFSMVDTIASGRRAHGSGTTAAALATFAVGAVAGGVATYATLGLLGAALATHGEGLAGLAAIAVAAAAAVGEARGVRIVPQIRRQVPEPWRRTMPLPAATALYGGLLGLGFTTFVLTLAVWALAGISIALGNPLLGAAIGAAFGAGRAMPVVLIVPLHDRPLGARLADLMAERPAILRGFRLADAVALAACAVALTADDAAAAPATLAPRATDPSVAGRSIAWQEPGGGGVLRRGAETVRLPGTHPAVGGSLVAWRVGDHVTIARIDTLAPVGGFTAAGVDKLAVSDRWIVHRARDPRGRDLIVARPIVQPAAPRVVASVPPPAEIGRPALEGDVLAFHVASSRLSRILEVDLATGSRRTVRVSRRLALLNPSITPRRMLYVTATACGQELRVERREPRPAGGAAATPDVLGGVLLRGAPPGRRDRGFEGGHTSQGSEPSSCPQRARPPPRATLWTTAPCARAAYVTLLRATPAGTRATIVRVRR